MFLQSSYPRLRTFLTLPFNMGLSSNIQQVAIKNGLSQPCISTQGTYQN